mgnify:CR=1 FL=1
MQTSAPLEPALTQPQYDRSPDAPRGPHPAVAGSMLLAAIVAGGAAGFGIGALLGAAVPLGLAGIFAGLVGGVALVIARFRGI